MGQSAIELGLGHVAHRAGATDANRLVEIEFAVLQLADAGQPLAQRIKAIGLGLEFAQARGQCVDLALRIAAGLVQLRLLGLDLAAKQSVVGDAGAGADRDARAQQQGDRDGRAASAVVAGLLEHSRQLGPRFVYDGEIGHVSDV